MAFMLALAALLGSEPAGDAPLLALDGEARHLAFDRGGTHLAIEGDGHVRVVRLADGKTVDDRDVGERVFELALDGSRARWLTDVFARSAAPKAPGEGAFETTLATALPDGRWLVAASWRPGRGVGAPADTPDGASPERLVIVTPRTGAVRKVVWQGVTRPAAIAAGRKTIASGDLGVRLFDGRGTRELEAGAAGIAALALDPGETRLAGGDVAGHLMLWDLARGARVADIAAHTGAVRAVALDATWIVSAGDDGHVTLRALSAPERAVRDQALGAPVIALAWHAARGLVAVGLAGARPRILVLRLTE